MLRAALLITRLVLYAGGCPPISNTIGLSYCHRVVLVKPPRLSIGRRIDTGLRIMVCLTGKLIMRAKAMTETSTRRHGLAASPC